MRIEGKEFRTIWYENNVVKIVDQTKVRVAGEASTQAF